MRRRRVRVPFPGSPQIPPTSDTKARVTRVGTGAFVVWAPKRTHEGRDRKMTLSRSSLLALTVSAALIGGATLAAADGPSRGGAEWPNIPWTWTGFYAGVHLGSVDAGRDDGLIGGVQFGKNWQM